ncbi:glycosyl hydrolase [Paludisphaera mucosa]|uniref:Glycosyl hydrolase n=1 Tax=Paludisphaera mucosa TaxID=3030827 RepID=A0ABT6FBB6_9BACT|nr:glycosyl hydrolase [Paludisphaera mucosa]MDG3004796.1 glycosyl hydrolase [Paludisphaera mucosa]
MSPQRHARLFASLLVATTSSIAVARAEESLAKRFAEPSRSTRILKIIHNWPDAPEAQDALVQRLDGQGFGGVVSNVAFDQYLESEPKWAAFRRGIGEARKAGFTQWLYDEKGYPSGNAGGLVLRDHPEWEASGLLIADARTEGPAVALVAPPGEVFLAAAFPERDGRIDRDARVDLAASVRDGKLAWTPPAAGAWRVVLATRSRLFDGTHADSNLFSHVPYPNLLMPEPTRKFLELTHRAYAGRLSSDLAATFQATFTDEPSLMSFFLKPMTYKVLPWAPGLPIEFRERRGYDLSPFVADLIVDAGPEGSKHRHDFWLTVGELVSENYFGQIQAWGRSQGVPSGGHLLLEEPIASHVADYGDLFRCLRRMDAPSIDCLTSIPSEAPWFVARLAASAAELEGHALVMSETSDHVQRYRSQGDARPIRKVSEAEIRGTIHRLMLGGVNCITSYYSFDGLDDDALRRLNAHVGRAGMMIRGGAQVADVAVVYPIESLWARFEPSRHMTADAVEANRVETIYREALDRLFAARRDPTIVDARALAEARVEGDALVHGELRWRVVVLPGVDTLPTAAWETLDRFAASGGVVVAIGARPENSASRFPDPDVRAIAARLLGAEATVAEPRVVADAAGGGGVFLPDGSASLLPAVLDAVLDPDVAATRPDSPLRATHRRIDGHDLYLIANDGDAAVSEAVRLPLAPGATAEIWEPATGAVRPLAVVGRGEVPIALGPYGAALVRATGVEPRGRRPLATGALPNVRLTRLKLPEPVVGRGEFVREATEPRDGSWTFRATLTKGAVDTHLFASFPFAPALDLSGVDALVVDAAVAPGQRTPTRLLVVVREADGGEFLASTSRSLGTAGTARAFVPWSSFAKAGWSHEGDEALDRSRVAEIRVGWGGYFGAEGETIAFRLDGVETAAVGAK